MKLIFERMAWEYNKYNKFQQIEINFRIFIREQKGRNWVRLFKIESPQPHTYLVTISIHKARKTFN